VTMDRTRTDSRMIWSSAGMDESSSLRSRTSFMSSDGDAATGAHRRRRTGASSPSSFLIDASTNGFQVMGRCSSEGDSDKQPGRSRAVAGGAGCKL